MFIADYAQAVYQSDQFAHLSKADRQRISVYGLVSEIGSVIAAVKKRKLGEGGMLDTTDGRLTRHELREELGDAMWYCFALARLEEGLKDDILANQLEYLLVELDSDNHESEMFRNLLTKKNLEEFRKQAKTFPRKKKRTFSDFQATAFLTARTKSDELVETCLAALMLLGAQLMRLLIPETERKIHRDIKDRETLDILGKIAWHISAIATVYDLTLDDIAEANISKADLRRPRTLPTPLHDEEDPLSQRFPRSFEIKFLTIGQGRARMYMGAHQLGNDLTDNSYDPDGYRFHDVLHLSHVAHLGWSPVIRALMKRKRKNSEKDEVEDGARAQIVEEALLKVVHSEGKEIADIAWPDTLSGSYQLFSDEIDIPLSFFKLIRRYVRGLEVDKNSFEEWKAAIRAGHHVYHELVKEGQGTVLVDLERRELTFRPEVIFDVPAAVAGIGSCSIALEEFSAKAAHKSKSRMTSDEKARDSTRDGKRLALLDTVKTAVLRSVGIDDPEDQDFLSISLTEVEAGKFSVKANSALQETMWALGVIAFKISVTTSQNNVYCTALACCDSPNN